jgi:2-hydroxy-3-keto-5-methylthiopentenyl-1-phosphate phosphatase
MSIPHRIADDRLAAPLPGAADSQVWIDFDGTITTRDVLDELIQRYAINDSWKLIEERWQAGLIGSKQCLGEEFSLVRISKNELDEFLQTIPVDPGWPRLQELLLRKKVPFTIVSDGIDSFIHRILGVQEKSLVRSNSIQHCQDRLKLICPHQDSACESAAAHCKCASLRKLQQPRRRGIYIGDGRSDLCPALKADVVFAKTALAQGLDRQGVAYRPFATLMEVAEALTWAWDWNTPQPGEAS